MAKSASSAVEMNPRRAATALAAFACVAPRRLLAMMPAVKLRVLAEPFPPLQYADAAGRVRGSAHAILKSALDGVSTQLPLDVDATEFVPLRRALQMAMGHANVIALSVARTPEREANFRWLGTVSPYELWLYRWRRKALPPLHGVAQLKGKGLRFGVQADSNFHEWLLRQGFAVAPDNSVIDPVPHNEMNFDKARVGRIDLFAHPEVSFAYRAAQHHLLVADFEKVLRIDELSTPLWAVTGLQTDARLVNLLTQQLRRMHGAGQAERLRVEAMKEFDALYRLEGR